MKRASTTIVTLLLAGSALVSSACKLNQQTNTMTPTGPGGSSSSSTLPAGSTSYVGSWVSEVSIPSASSCTSFQWNISDQTASTMSGDFFMTCNGIKISGDASAQLNGNQVALAVDGTAINPGLPPCPFAIRGTGTIVDSATLTIPYDGTTCFGPVHGTQTLKKKSNSPSPPALPPASAPDPLLGCGGLEADKPALVTCIHDRLNAPYTPAGAFDVARRVAWALRGEGGGLLIKNAGENIVPWQGYSFAAGRICYPDGHIFKVLSDVPSTNGPMWLDNGMVDPGLYVPAIDPNSPL